MASRDRVIAFGPYRLDRVEGQLSCGARVLPLRLKTFAVLEYLASNAQRLVTRDELLDVVWPDTHVTPGVLAGCIREIRRVLGDDARTPRFVETVHRRGYRFIAPPRSPSAAWWAATPWTASGDGRTGLDRELAALARSFADLVAAVVSRKRS